MHGAVMQRNGTDNVNTDNNNLTNDLERDLMLMMSVVKTKPDPYDPEQLLTIQQVAQLTQYSVQTLRNRIDSGGFLPATHRDGRQVRWRRADLLNFLAQFRTDEL